MTNGAKIDEELKLYYSLFASAQKTKLMVEQKRVITLYEIRRQLGQFFIEHSTYSCWQFRASM